MKKKWTNELIESEIKNCMVTLQIERMPTTRELELICRKDLINAITKTKKFTGWANYLSLNTKQSETKKGNKYEDVVKTKIEQISNHLFVTKMTTLHPFDLLVNNCVKIDVKVSKPCIIRGSRCHFFGLNKRYATCDIYICVALNEQDDIEGFYIIPSAHVQIKTLYIGKDSKYDRYKNNWIPLYNFVNEYEKAISLF